VILSFPGLGVQLGARVLAEIGDDRQRFADARGPKAYAGSSPITRASGKKSSITRRRVKNDRLNHAGYLWAFAAPNGSPGAKAHYRRRATSTETGTRPPCATSSTGCSVSSIAASGSTRCSKNRRRLPPRWPPRLDS
jgi:transposase